MNQDHIVSALTYKQSNLNFFGGYWEVIEDFGVEGLRRLSLCFKINLTEVRGACWRFSCGLLPSLLSGELD